MDKKKCAVLFSGGKDSCLALHKASIDYDVVYLLSLIPKTSDSWMFHKPDLALLEKQADMLGKELIIMETKGEKEKELEDLKEIIDKVKDKIDVLVIGGIASNYQGDRINKICKEIDLEVFAPLWDYSPEKLWNELLNLNFKVIITKISSEGIPKEMLGKIVNKEMLEELMRRSKKYGFKIDFEGGDAETAVLFMPGMNKEIKIKGIIESEDKYRHFLRIKSVE